MVFQGTPTPDSIVACGPEIVGFQVQAGTTYFIMAFSDTGDLTAGNLDLTLRNEPTPVVHVSVAKGGAAFHRGAATVHGTYACRNADFFAGITVHLLQRAGRLKIQGDGGADVRCDGARHRWTARVVSPWGTYAPGFAVARATIFGCGFVECSQAVAKRQVHLTSASGSARWMQRPTTGLTVPRSATLVRTHWPSS
jgi:hypothetical protein